MASAALHYCSGSPTCPNKVTSGCCPEHSQAKRQQERRFYSGRQAAISTVSLPPVNYGRRWQRAAKAYLATHPYCVDCQSDGYSHGLATEVDHDEPHRGNAELFWDERNWRARCKPHHSRKTAREVGFGGQR